MKLLRGARRDSRDRPGGDPWMFMDVAERDLGGAVVDSILRAFGGRRIYVPSHPKPHHTLCKAIGVRSAAVLAKEFGGTMVIIPLRQTGANAIRREKIKRALSDGRSAGSIAAEFGITSRAVSKVRAEMRRENAQ
jgi:Mor family transcriptional regulator